MVGQKRALLASFGGMLGRLNKQCLSMALKMRNCRVELVSALRECGGGRRTCHAKGTFLKFDRTTRKAKMRVLEPGPVTVLISKLRILALEATVVAAMLAMKMMLFTGYFIAAVADAMV